MLSIGLIFKSNFESKQCTWEIRYNIDYSDKNSLLFGSSKHLLEVFTCIHLANLYNVKNTCTLVRTTQGSL